MNDYKNIGSVLGLIDWSIGLVFRIINLILAIILTPFVLVLMLAWMITSPILKLIFGKYPEQFVAWVLMRLVLLFLSREQRAEYRAARAAHLAQEQLNTQTGGNK